jgi:hypothetical protein
MGSVGAAWGFTVGGDPGINPPKAVLGFHTVDNAAALDYWQPDGGAFNSVIWNHVAMTYDGKVTARFYVNGGDTGSIEVEAGTYAPGDSDLTLGDAQLGDDFSIEATLSQIRVYDRKLEPEEVARIAAH